MTLPRLALIFTAALTAGCLRLRPASTAVVERTPARIERGAYLANGIGGCLHCHSSPEENSFGFPPRPGTAGAGGLCWDPSLGFPGTLCATNLTADVETGLGGWTDGEILRAIREGVGRHDNGLFPIMPYRAYASFSDEDAMAIVAYLRTLPPVRNAVPARQINFPVSLFIRRAPRPLEGPVAEPNRADPIAYGRYLGKSCEHCHSPVNGRGQLIAGREFSGVAELKMPGGSRVVSSNLTPHPTGLASWTPDQFIARFHGYRAAAEHPVAVQKGQNTLMPWLPLSTLTKDDLGALYAYLRTLPPLDNRVIAFPAAPEAKTEH